MDIIIKALAALQDFYMDSSSGKSLDYTYGYMDALAIIRGMLDDNRHTLHPPTAMLAVKEGQ